MLNRVFSEVETVALKIVPRALHYFEQVAQLGSIQAASRELGISASAILRQITTIEEDMGTQIFDRNTKGMTLTPTGYHLLELARDWRLDSARLWSTVQSERGVEQGHITIAAMDGMVNGFVPELVKSIVSHLPRVQISIDITSPINAAKEVLNGDVDIAAVVNVPPDDNLFFHWSREFPLGCILTPSHPAAELNSIRLSELIQHPAVFQDSSLSIRKLLEAHHGWIFEQAKDTVVVNSIQLMKQLVASGRYLAITSEFDAGPELESGQLKFIPIADDTTFSQTFSVISNLQMPRTGIFDQIAELTVDVLNHRVGRGHPSV
ncbi:MAG: LysR family transcriptional regulator [Paracoccaceae bacterium]|nr:LysR family transcriptional regulator [Paracoccaceae bacterium]